MYIDRVRVRSVLQRARARSFAFAFALAPVRRRVRARVRRRRECARVIVCASRCARQEVRDVKRG